MLKLWVRRLRYVSIFSLPIRIRRKLFGLFLFMSFALPLPAFASSANYFLTSTPTIDAGAILTQTPQSLYSSPTPVFLDSTCPMSGTPIAGLGTVTPGLLWSSQCLPCMLTQTPQPSATLAPTSTGTITPTTTPTQTATPSPTPGGLDIYMDLAMNTGFTSVTMHPITAVGFFQWAYDDQFVELTVNNPGIYVGYVFYAVVNEIAADNWSHAGYDPDPQANSAWQSLDPGVLAEEGHYYLAMVPWSNTSGYTAAGTTRETVWGSEANYNAFVAANSGDEVVGGSVNVLDNPATIIFAYEAAANRGGGSTSQYVDVTFYPVGGVYYGEAPIGGTPTPTPTPTGIAPTYCSEVNGGSYGFGNDELELPFIGRGEIAACAGLPEVTIPLSGLNWLPGIEFEDSEFPGLSLCFYPVYFGDIDIFGVSVSLELLVGIMSAVLVIRWYFRS